MTFGTGASDCAHMDHWLFTASRPPLGLDSDLLSPFLAVTYVA